MTYFTPESLEGGWIQSKALDALGIVDHWCKVNEQKDVQKKMENKQTNKHERKMVEGSDRLRETALQADDNFPDRNKTQFSKTGHTDTEGSLRWPPQLPDPEQWSRLSASAPGLLVSQPLATHLLGSPRAGDITGTKQLGQREAQSKGPVNAAW